MFRRDRFWRKKAKEKKYPCQVLSGCAISEECMIAKPTGVN